MTGSTGSTRSSRHVQHVERVVYSRYVTWRAKRNLGYTPYFTNRRGWLPSSFVTTYWIRINLTKSGVGMYTKVQSVATPLLPWSSVWERKLRSTGRGGRMDILHGSHTATGLITCDVVVRDPVGVVDASVRPRSVKPAAFDDDFLRVPVDSTAAGIVRAHLFARRDTTCFRSSPASVLLTVYVFSPRCQHTLCARNNPNMGLQSEGGGWVVWPHGTC